MTNVTLTLTTVELDDIINALEEYAGGPSDMTEALKDKVAAAERQAARVTVSMQMNDSFSVVIRANTCKDAQNVV